MGVTDGSDSTDSKGIWELDKRPKTRARRRLCRGVWGAGGNGIWREMPRQYSGNGRFQKPIGRSDGGLWGRGERRVRRGSALPRRSQCPGSRAGAWVRCLTCLASLKLAASTLWL